MTAPKPNDESSVRLILGDATAEMARLVKQARTDVRVFAPYLTSDVATNILADADRSSARVYTLWDAKLFAQGGSSLDALRSLLESGFAVYHLPNLHAKIVLAGGSALTIGSQNLTERGMHAWEATLVTSDQGVISAALTSLADWEREGTRISVAMVDDLAARLPALCEQYAQFAGSADELEELVAEAERARQSAKALTQIHEGLGKVPRSRREYACTVSRLNGPSGHYRSLFPDDRSDKLTTWLVEGGVRSLDPEQRFACLSLPAGWLGWVRLVPGRITYVGDYVPRTDEQFGDFTCRVSTKARWVPSLAKGNLEFVLRPGAYSRTAPALTVTGLFTVDGIEIIEVLADPSSDASSAGWCSGVRRAIEDNKRAFRDTMLKHVTNPFNYPRKFEGCEADSFFGPLQSRHRLKLVLVQGCPVLVAERL